MYETFYNLKVDPFRLSPDHVFSYQHPTYKKARTYVRYFLKRAEGFALITGRPGTGKTTLINDVLSSIDESTFMVASLPTTQLQGEHFLRAVAYAFGLPAEGLDHATLLRDLGRFFLEHRESGRRILLIVDEAQDLQPSALAELRLLANLQRGRQLLVQVLLIGQEQFGTMLHTPEMEQFRQRVVAGCHLQPLSVVEMRDYVEHRLKRSGWSGDPSFQGGVFPLIHQVTQGIPRQVNLVFSRLLLHGCVEELHTLTSADARTVVEELGRERLLPAGVIDEPALGTVAPEDARVPYPLELSAAPAVGLEQDPRTHPDPHKPPASVAPLTPAPAGPGDQSPSPAGHRPHPSALPKSRTPPHSPTLKGPELVSAASPAMVSTMASSPNRPRLVVVNVDEPTAATAQPRRPDKRSVAPGQPEAAPQAEKEYLEARAQRLVPKILMEPVLRATQRPLPSAADSLGSTPAPGVHTPGTTPAPGGWLSRIGTSGSWTSRSWIISGSWLAAQRPPTRQVAVAGFAAAAALTVLFYVLGPQSVTGWAKTAISGPFGSAAAPANEPLRPTGGRLD